MKFQTYCELTQFLLLAEQQQLLLLRNNESKPSREANATEIPTRRPKGGWKFNQQKRNRTPYAKTKDKSNNLSFDFGSRSSSQSNQCGFRKCFKCGRNGHMQKDCRIGECKKCGCPGPLTRDCKTNECQRCGRVGHESRECRAGVYTEKLYKEL